MDWMSCHNIFKSVIEESSKRQIRFKSPLTSAVGEFFRQVNSVPDERRAGFWLQQGGIVQKWVQEELFAMGYADQRFKYKKNGATHEVEFMVQNLTSGSPIEMFGQDTVEAVLQVLFIALKDAEPE